MACLRMARKHGNTFENVGRGISDDKIESEKVMSEAAQQVTNLTRMYHGEVAAKLLAQQRLRHTSAKLRVEESKPKLTVSLTLIIMTIGIIIGVFLAAI